ncbi:SET domain-containing protein [Cerasicoccus fimbriatus]|uniref:SET domain-containing protein n=1 Tax=Cerasicoccus fimbriatus TaxID=3014554 RepID=UPI0022B4060A|nr:SET domain-containing protein [Cerasicoccus sp. TK19100]
MHNTLLAPQIGAFGSLVEVRSSQIHGLGVFAREFIPAGTVWWRANQDNVLMLNKTQFETIMSSNCNANIQEFLNTCLIYGYYSVTLDKIIICLDNARYVNHSLTPNSGGPLDFDGLTSTATRDILPGEEIVEDYTGYDHCPWSNLFCSLAAKDGFQ